MSDVMITNNFNLKAYFSINIIGATYVEFNALSFNDLTEK